MRYKNFDTNLKDAHSEYSEYCSMNNMKASCKIEFNKRLEAYKITSFKSGNYHNKFNFKHAKLEEIAVANKWKHSTDQYENGDQFVDENKLDNGISKDLEEKDAEIKALREQIEVLKNKLAVSPLDVDVEEKDEEPITAQSVVVDPFDVIIKELKDQEEWIADFVRQTKPKKKINKKQIQRDIFEIDFMCD